MNIVIVGHIDHGKSTLIGRLLFDTGSVPESILEEVKSASKGGEIEFAYLLDCLEEERQQNITIDTTQNFFSTKKREYTIIDAPGHREFLKNMVSGASLAHAAVLMLDAAQGIEEQTRRHASILKLMGLDNVVVAINKMDAVEFSEKRFSELREEIGNFLSKAGFKEVKMVPISAKAGENVSKPSDKMPWYQGPNLLEVLDAMDEPVALDGQELRLSVQDVYTVKGEKVVVGRVESGTVRPGMQLTVLPSGEQVTVKEIPTLNGTLQSAGTEAAVGLKLSKTDGIVRGNILSSGKPPSAHKELDALLFSLAEQPLACGESINLQCTTQSVPAKIVSIRKRLDSSTLEELGEGKEVQPTEIADVRVELASPVLFEEFKQTPGLGRFVLAKGGDVQAAGIIRAI